MTCRQPFINAGRFFDLFGDWRWVLPRSMLLPAKIIYFVIAEMCFKATLYTLSYNSTGSQLYCGRSP